MSNSYEICISNMATVLSNLSDVIVKTQARISDITQTMSDALILLVEKTTEYVEWICEMFSKNIDESNNVNFSLTLSTSLYKSNAIIHKTAPRAPPKQSLKEKIEIKYFYIKIKYGKYAMSACKTILQNETYNCARAIFIFVLKTIFHF